MGVVIQDGMSSDWWGAQRRLSCTMTVSYNAEYVERGCRKGCTEEVERKCQKGVVLQGGELVGMDGLVNIPYFSY